MPLPLLALALPILIEAAQAAMVYIVRRVLLAVAVDLAWDYLRPRLLDWVEEYVPHLVLYTIKYVTGLNIELPITPAGLTNAVNEQIGEPIFKDITDSDQVREDAAKFALQRIAIALPGLTLEKRDFIGTEAARRRMRYKVRLFMQTQVRGAMEVGESAVISQAMTAQIMAQLQAGYEWRPHELKMDLKNVVGRYMARWYTRHLTRTWVER